MTTPIDTDPLEDLRDKITKLLYGDWITYEKIKSGQVSETTTETIDQIMAILSDREQKARVDGKDPILQASEFAYEYMNSHKSRLQPIELHAIVEFIEFLAEKARRATLTKGDK